MERLPMVPGPRSLCRVVLGALAVVLAAGSLEAALAQQNLRNSFPGRRIGGGTRGECSSRLLAHLVPASSVFAPGATATIGLLEGPTAQPRPLQLSFRPLTSAGTADAAQARTSTRDLPASPAGVVLLTGLTTAQQRRVADGLSNPYFWAGIELLGAPW